MSIPAEPDLRPGGVYRTRDLAPWGANASRLARRLVENGTLLSLSHGLFVHPKRGRFGTVPASDDEVMRGFLDGSPFVFTGSEYWNTLGLGTTAVSSAPLVYNTKRSGTFVLGGRPFILRRVAFPPDPPSEWFVVDLFEHADQAGASRADLTAALGRAVARKAFDAKRLRDMAQRYGTKSTQGFISAALVAAA